MTEFVLNYAKRTRIGGPKVKTGCITCKIRRVKCDEGKPACNRCINTGRNCDGYASQPRKQEKASPIHPDRQLAILPGSAKERHSIDFFFHHTAKNISGYFDPSFWDHHIMRLGHSEPAIRHAVVAISTIHERAAGKCQATVTDMNDCFAIQSYNKAITCLTSQRSVESSLHIPLTACVLFVCLEFFRGDVFAALRHIQGGLSILNSYQDSKSERRISATHSPTSSYSSNPVEGDIIQAIKSIFSQLHFVNALFDPTSSPTVAPSGGCLNPFSSTPLVFTSVGQARQMRYDLGNRATALIMSASKAKYSMGISTEQITDQYLLEVQFQRWTKAMDEFMVRQYQHMSSQEQKAAKVTMMHALSSWINLSTCFSPEEMVFDQYKDKFQKIVELADGIIRDGSRCPSQALNPFSFELGLIPPLQFTVMKCRSPSVRRRALAILGSSHWREGLFDSYRAYKVFSRVMAIEEAELDDSQAPPDCQSLFSEAGVERLPSEVARIHYAHMTCVEYGASQQPLTIFTKPNGVYGEWCIKQEIIKK